MTDPINDRAIAILQDAPFVALPLDELARRLGVEDPDGLARDLAGDPRLLVLEPPGLPAPVCDTPERQAAYDRAIRDAGLRSPRRVALAAPALVPLDAGLGPLLRVTTARLLSPGPDGEALTAAAERVERALRAILDPEP